MSCVTVGSYRYLSLRSKNAVCRKPYGYTKTIRNRQARLRGERHRMARTLISSPSSRLMGSMVTEMSDTEEMFLWCAYTPQQSREPSVFYCQRLRHPFYADPDSHPTLSLDAYPDSDPGLTGVKLSAWGHFLFDFPATDIRVLLYIVYIP
jgi:hypothetical protein